MHAMKITSTSSFKSGNTVRSAVSGRTYTFVSAINSHAFYARTSDSDRVVRLSLLTREYQLVKTNILDVTSKKHFIIAVLDKDSGQPLPAPHPVVFETAEKAAAVAMEMAQKHQNQTFVVYQAVGSHRAQAMVSQTY